MRGYTKVSINTIVQSTRRCASGVITPRVFAYPKDDPMTMNKPKHLPESDSLSSYSDTALPTPLTRRGFIARSVAALSVGPFVFPSLNQARTMTTDLDVVARAPDTRQAQKTSIRPFNYRAPQSELDDLRRRILAARLPEKEPVSDWSQG